MAMTRVFERLYLGDARDADNLAVVNPSGITGVVNVCTETNQERREGIKYAHHPLDEYEWILPRRFELIMTGIGKLVRGGTVLIHCAAGSSRSPRSRENPPRSPRRLSGHFQKPSVAVANYQSDAMR